MRIFFSLLNYNCSDELNSLARLLISKRPSECNLTFLITDNSGNFEIEDDSHDFFSLGEVDLLVNNPERNLGFGCGHNNNITSIGFLHSDRLVICNSDITIRDAVAFYDQVLATPDNCIWSPTILNFNNVWYAGGVISSSTGELRVVTKIPCNLERTDFVTGCMMVTSGRCFQQLNGFNPDYFMYVDDLEFSLRALRAGFCLQVAPIKIEHRVGSGGVSNKQYSNVYLYENTKNRLDFAMKYFGLKGFLYAITKYGLLRTVQLLIRGQFRALPIVYRALKDGVSLCIERYL